MGRHKVIFSDRQKEVKIPSGIRMLLRRTCTAVLEYENFEGNAEINISFVNDEEIKMLNQTFRNIDKSTDVLSFPLVDNQEYIPDPISGLVMLGDVVISVEHAMAQAKEFGHTLNREMAYLTVHSVLHLLGYDHVGDKIEALHMREHEEAVLEKLGLAREDCFVDEEEESYSIWKIQNQHLSQ